MSRRRAVEEVGEILTRSGVSVAKSATFPWISNRAPFNTETNTPPRIQYRLTAAFARLGGDWGALERKRRALLRFDLRVDDTTLIEVDSKHHFTSARLTTLDYYDDLEHNLDLDRYRELCHALAPEADRQDQSRESPEFPFRGGRAAQRAYFDLVKDLLTAAHGFTLIRLPATKSELVDDFDPLHRLLSDSQPYDDPLTG